jgi:uncharacterized membrane protein YqjE
LFYLDFFGLPIAFLVLLLMLAFRGRLRPALEGAAFFALAFGAGIWAIRQSLSSTAAIGFLFLPLMAMIAGLLGLASGFARSSPEKPNRIVGWVCFAAALLIVALTVNNGAQTIQRNRRRDAAYDAFAAEIARDRDTIAAALKQRPGHQREWLDSSMRARWNDRAFLLAALPNDSVSPEILDSLASRPDLGIALEAVRNPNTPSQTLVRVYRTASYPDYFFQALAGHRHTPPDVLRDLYHRPATVTGLEIWFAGNPSTPYDILADIAEKTSDPNVIAALLENKSLDCRLLTRLAVKLMKEHNRDANDPNVARLNELLPSKCPNTTQ